MGWSAINAIIGAQLLVAVDPKIPGYGGILVIAAGTSIISIFGYKIVHTYANWAWMPTFVVFMIVLGEFAHAGAFNKLPMHSGNAEAGSVLRFAASVFGFATGWTSLAADYGVYQPSNVSSVRVFAWTYAGLLFPLLFLQILGLAIATACVPASTNTFTNPYFDSYQGSGIGGLLAAVLLPPLGRFGQFCLVILALSIIANNAPNMYSLTFSLQVMGRWTQSVPRFIWSFLGTVVYCAIAIPGYNKFEDILTDFMLLIVRFLPFSSPPQPSPHCYPNHIQLPPPLNKKKGLLARNLRRRRPDRTLPIRRPPHPALRRLHLHLRQAAPARHRRRGSRLRGRRRRGARHGAGVAHRPHWETHRRRRIRWRRGVSVGVWLCGCGVCGAANGGVEGFWTIEGEGC